MPSGTQNATMIIGRKISLRETNPTFILLLFALLVMVVLYLRDIYNCGPFLFGMVACGAYIYLPKVWNVYEYIFVVTVGEVSREFSCTSNLSEVNANSIIPKFMVVDKPIFQKGNFYIETQTIKVTLGDFKGSFLFSDDDLQVCFEKNMDNFDINISCDKFNYKIKCGDLPELKTFHTHIMTGKKDVTYHIPANNIHKLSNKKK